MMQSLPPVAADDMVALVLTLLPPRHRLHAARCPKCQVDPGLRVLELYKCYTDEVEILLTRLKQLQGPTQ